MKPLLLLSLALGVLCSPFDAFAQDSDLGRFRLGMTVAEVRAAAPEQQWAERAFGADLMVLNAERPVRIGRIGFTPMLSFREGRLEVVQFSGGGPIAQPEQCDRVLVETVTALQPQLGPLNSYRAPAEFGVATETRTTEAGSEVRFYNPNGTTRAGFATRRGEQFVLVSSLAAPIPPLDLACVLSIEIQAPLTDFAPMPPPTVEELAAAQEIDPEWAVSGGPRVTELTMPADAIASAGRVRVSLDCLVISDQRINCAVESEEPAGMHFGDGAVAASRFYRIEPVISGQPTLGRRVRFTIRYELGATSQ